jgi:hypothetical protein
MKLLDLAVGVSSPHCFVEQDSTSSGAKSLRSRKYFAFIPDVYRDFLRRGIKVDFGAISFSRKDVLYQLLDGVKITHTRCLYSEGYGLARHVGI